jgi:hypothetical protein
MGSNATRPFKVQGSMFKDEGGSKRSNRFSRPSGEGPGEAIKIRELIAETLVVRKNPFMLREPQHERGSIIDNLSIYPRRFFLTTAEGRRVKNPGKKYSDL